MAFVRLPGIEGKVFVPGCDRKKVRKHPCPDCFSCQGCSEERCRLCRGETQSGCRGECGRSGDPHPKCHIS